MEKNTEKKFCYSDGSDFVGTKQTENKVVISTYSLLNENGLLKIEIDYFSKEGKLTIIKTKTIQKDGLKDAQKDILKDEKDEDFKIESIKFYIYGNGYDFLKSKELKKFKDSGNKENFLQILKDISDSGNYGIDSGLIYANILVNSDQHDNLILYKTQDQNFKDIETLKALENIIVANKDKKSKLFIKNIDKYFIKKEENFEKDFIFKKLTNNEQHIFKTIQEIQTIPKIYNNFYKILTDEQKGVLDKYKKLCNEYIVPNFSKHGHVNLYLLNNIDKNILLFDTQQTENIINDSRFIKIFDGFDLQTYNGGGCCGFWVSEICIELLNNYYKYNDLENNKQQRAKLILNSAIKVSEYIDKDKKAINSTKEEGFIQLCTINSTSYYINKQNSIDSKSININGIFKLLINCEIGLKLKEKEQNNLINEQFKKQKEIKNSPLLEEGKKKIQGLKLIPIKETLEQQPQQSLTQKQKYLQQIQKDTARAYINQSQQLQNTKHIIQERIQTKNQQEQVEQSNHIELSHYQKKHFEQQNNSGNVKKSLGFYIK